LWPEGGKLGLAVSGGPDSMAMLLLAEAAIPGQFEVATVDHGLRAEAADECAMVARVCAERGICCEVLSVAVAPGNVQAMAREARYQALADWKARRGLTPVATAHHVDDQVETLLMRLNRGSGLRGLAGVREGQFFPELELRLIRPLLSFRRSELAYVVEVAGLAVVDDPSNTNDRFDRVRLRKALAGNDWLDPLAIATSAAHLAEADAALDYATRRLWLERVTLNDTGDEYRYRPPAPRAIELRLMHTMVSELGQSPRGRDVARLLDRLDAGEGGNVGGVLATVEGEEWVFRREPPRRTS
jgi:tRNA(Ile)-lysidine synthase